MSVIFVLSVLALHYTIGIWYHVYIYTHAAQVKFLGNPNNAFLAQGLVALVFGGLHVLKYEEFGSKVAEPLCNLIGAKFGEVSAVLPHIK